MCSNEGYVEKNVAQKQKIQFSHLFPFIQIWQQK